jgi:tetratricopeptide (TPR) repeat protein
MRWNDYGVDLYTVGRLQDAREALAKAWYWDPQSALVSYNLGCVQFEQADYNAALGSFYAATAAEPDMPDCWRNLAACWTKLGDAKKAARCFGKFLKAGGRPSVY